MWMGFLSFGSSRTATSFLPIQPYSLPSNLEAPQIRPRGIEDGQHVCRDQESQGGNATGKGSSTSSRRKRMAEQCTARTVEESLLPHLDAAYNLARWLIRNPTDAED